ncbi:hypothetical protein [Pediococcus ethanolidurans]|uniref:hypothetical protein n=1 Tax=Pediococcus ethanolidurans TaxID=319653 RepID=UPI00345E8949
MKSVVIKSHLLPQLVYLLLDLILMSAGALITYFDHHNYFMGLFVLAVFGWGTVMILYRITQPILLEFSTNGIKNRMPFLKRKRFLIEWNNITNVSTSQRYLLTTLVITLKSPVDGKDTFAFPLVGASSRAIEEATFIIEQGITYINTFQEEFETHSQQFDYIKADIEFKQKFTQTNSKVIWYFWTFLEIIAAVLAWRVPSYIITKLTVTGDLNGMFVYFGLATPILLSLSELSYWIIYKLGWHSTVSGRKIFLRRNTLQIPIFVKTDVAYQQRRQQITKRARCLYTIFIVTRIIITTVLVSIFMVLMEANLESIFGIIIILVGIFLVFSFWATYQVNFIKIFHLKIIQTENNRPHFDDVSE